MTIKVHACDKHTARVQFNPTVACTTTRHSAARRHQSAERPMILRQISSLIYPKIQRRQVIMNVLHPSCARPPRWSPPVLWRRFEDGLASICVLIHSCKMSEESETTGGQFEFTTVTDTVLVPSAIVLLYNMVLTTTSKPTFLPWSLFDYLSYY